MQKTDASNPLFSLASDLVNHTSRHIFLTGKAGTGKTTFLKYIRENCAKKMVVVAPTGVAAINAGGVTIHSFFQLPFSPFIPEAKGFRPPEEVTNKHTLLSRLRLNSERRKIMQELELLVIDEISMVRCDVLDAIDLVLRHIRHRPMERFGGVQVLFIGDMFQLPPVVKGDEWNLLKEFYESPYFFDSHVMKEEPPVYVEFTKIYRQTEEGFIHLLNKVRNNEMNDDDLRALHQRYQPDFFGDRKEGYILLTTHNEKAKEINRDELARLPGLLYSFKAEVENDFPSTAFPAEEALQLKTGAQVMFIKNDTEKGKRYFNGKIGVVTELSKDKIVVQCADDTEPIEVKKEKWENIRYTLDRSTRELNEDVLGSFSQYPLRLAWAITIHKSQGLTFEKAVIDAGKAFAPGQVYVALSRCTNLEGLVLHSRIQPNRLYADDKIVRFTKGIRPLEELQQEFLESKRAYGEKILLSLFDFAKTIGGLNELHAFLVHHRPSFNPEVFPWLDALIEQLKSLQATAEKFHVQLKMLSRQMDSVEDNYELQERLKTAAAWFGNGIRSVNEKIPQSPAVTDSSLHAKEFNELVREVFVQLSQQAFLLQTLNGNFTIDNYHSRKKLFTSPSPGVNAYAGASDKKVELEHPALFYQLKKLRDAICSKRNLPIYLVAGSKTLEEMACWLPQSPEELKEINGFGKSKIESYGDEFLSIIKDYCLENGLSSLISEKPVPFSKKKESKASKKDTKAESFELYREGKTIQEISKERKLTVQTIEGHLAWYVEQGAIAAEKLVAPDKIALIESEVKDYDGGPIGLVKEKFGDRVTWAELRFALARMRYLQSSSHVDH